MLPYFGNPRAVARQQRRVWAIIAEEQREHRQAERLGLLLLFLVAVAILVNL